MPETNVTIFDLSQLPKQIYDFIFDDEETDTSRIFDQAKLSPEQEKRVNQLLRAVYLKKISVVQFVETAKAELSLPDNIYLRFVCDFIGFRLLPIDDYLDGGCTQVLKTLGADPSKYPSKRIVMRTVSPEALVSEVLHGKPVPVPADLDHRLREILESLVRGVRKDQETIDRLTRLEKIGGVGLDQKNAEELVSEIAEKLKSVQIAADVQVAQAPLAVPESAPTGAIVAQNQPAQESPVIAGKGMAAVATTVAAAVVQPSRVSKKSDAPTPEDDYEAKIIKEKVLPVVVPKTIKEIDDEIARATEEILAETAVAVPQGLTDRYKLLVTSRLRDVRKPRDIRDLFVRETDKGGMGFNAATTDRVSAIIEKRFTEIRDTLQEYVNKEKENYVQKTANQSQQRSEERQRKEEADLEARFAALTEGKLKRPPAKLPPKPQQAAEPSAPVIAAPVIPAPVPKPANPVPAQVQTPAPVPSVSVPKPAPLPAVPPAPAPAPVKITPPPVPSVPAPLRPVAPRVLVPPVPVKPPAPPVPVVPPAKPVAADPPPAPKPEPAPAPPAPAPIAPKPPVVAAPVAPSPKMQDVRIPQRLVGPIEELRNLTLVDYRRLSSDPKEALLKIGDKLDLLEDQSYAMRIQGMQAWFDSEVNRMYLDIIKTSLTDGQPMAAVIRAREEAKTPTLTEREVNAIMEFNKKLKF